MIRHPRPSVSQACGGGGAVHGSHLRGSHLDYWTAIRAIDYLEISRHELRKQRRFVHYLERLGLDIVEISKLRIEM